MSSGRASHGTPLSGRSGCSASARGDRRRAKAAPLSASKRAGRGGNLSRNWALDKEGKGRNASAETGELEPAVVETERDHDVVGEIAGVDEAHRVVLVPDDLL